MRRRGSSRIGNADRINSDHTRKMKKKEKFKKRFVKYEELPEYMKDNEFIRGYYRCEWPLKDVFFSLFSLHNETLNIWTHLIGFLMFMGMTVMSFMEKTKLEGLIASWFGPGVQEPLMTMMLMMMMNNNSTNGLDTFLSDSYLKYIPKPSVLHMTSDYDAIPKWPWFVFLGGAMGCLICSSVSHLFACHSRSFNLFFWRLDYAGISLMIVCSFFAPIYYAFSCHPYSRFFYLTSISVLGILVIITLLAPVFSAAHFRSFRASLFLAMGFSGMIPAAHAVTLNWNHPLTLVSLGYEIAMGLFYAIGAAFYMSRIPERWKPGAFDIAGHSHQIFHVFVIAGALAHTAATLILMDLRRVSPTCNGSGSQGALGWTL